MLRRLIARVSGRAAEYAAAAFAMVLISGLSIVGLWVFSRPSPPPDRDVSFWRVLFDDRSTLGFLRAAIVGLSLYAIASVAALLVSGRWIKTFRSTGFDADDARQIETIRRLKAETAAARQERDEVLRLLQENLHG